MFNPTIARTGVSVAALERAALAGSNGAGINACVLCCDQWADEGRVGLEWFSRDGRMTVRSHDAMRADAARFANLLTARGVGPGDVVAAMLPRGAELLTVILGTWRAGAVFQPLATSLSPVAIDARINHTGRAATKLIVTDVANRARLDWVDVCPPVVVVAEGERVRPGDGDFMAELMGQSTWFTPVARHGDDPFLLLVGGRGGQARPVMPTLRSLLAILSSLRIGIEPNESDIGWDVADPAWSFGLFFSVLRPLLMGEAAVAHESDRVVAVVEMTPVRLAVSVWRGEALRLAA